MVTSETCQNKITLSLGLLFGIIASLAISWRFKSNITICFTYLMLTGYVRVLGLRCGVIGGNVTLLWVFDGDLQPVRTQWLKGSVVYGEIMAAYQDGFQAAPGWEDKVSYSPEPGYYPGRLILVNFTSAGSGNNSLYVPSFEYPPNEDGEIREYTGQWKMTT